jgi:hypothetical protein
MVATGQPARSRIPSPHPRRGHVGVVAGVGLALVFASPILATGATVTRGQFSAFAAGAGLSITGRAQMVRAPDGTTFVTIHVEGLQPGVTYPSHVHKQACADGDADGHYRFDPAGAATPPNEIWPGPFTANPAGIGNANTLAQGVAGASAMSVVVHAPTGAKIACADLR